MKYCIKILLILFGLSAHGQMFEGTAESYYEGNIDINTYFNNGKYILKDVERNFETKTARVKPEGVFLNPVFFKSITDSDNNWESLKTISYIEILNIPSDYTYFKIVDDGNVLFNSSTDNDNLKLNEPYILSGIQFKSSIPVLKFYKSFLDPIPDTIILDMDEGIHYELSTNGISLEYKIHLEPNYAVDVHYNLGVTFDYFKNVHDIEGLGFQNNIKAYVYKGNNGKLSFNAFARPRTNLYENDYLFFGSGIVDNIKPTTVLEIIAHEYSHLLLAKNNKLQTNNFNWNNDELNEKRAINESICDAFGIIVKHYYKTDGYDSSLMINTAIDWTVYDYGLGFFDGKILRDVSDPDNDNTDNNVVALSENNKKTNTYGHVQSNADISGDLILNGPNWVSKSYNLGEKAAYKNMGPANYWFYLIANEQYKTSPKLGTNDAGNSYSVKSIGIEKAQYLLFYLITESNDLDNSSEYEQYANATINAAIHFSDNSMHNFNDQDVQSIIAAWHAVGVLGDAINFCSSGEVIVSTNGVLEDGSLDQDYNNNQNCNWIIQPAGADSVTLEFNAFNLASGDSLTVYDGLDNSVLLAGPYTGNTIPPTITSTTGAVYLEFITDSNGVSSGWSLNYSANIQELYCDSLSEIYMPSGIISDGSGEEVSTDPGSGPPVPGSSNNYLNNSNCSWRINPENATYIDLTFTELDLENNVDYVYIYDGLNDNTPPIATITGNTLPGTISTNSGNAFIKFVSNHEITKQGWKLNFTSDGIQPCIGTTVLTASTGLVSDGSGDNNYGNNANCAWLIQPPNATSITLNFNELNLEDISSDGNSTILNDYLEIYEGIDDSSEPVATYSGNQFLPLIFQSNSNSLYVKFISNNSITDSGWEFSYSSSTGDFCAGTTVLNSATGVISDGSGSSNYNSNSDCRWLIQPENATSIELSFSSFDTELGQDGVVVYDGPDISYPYSVYSGSDIPETIYSTSGSMLVRFLSDDQNEAQGFEANEAQGFEANYVANIAPEGNVNAITTYQYWFNDDYASPVTESNFGAVNTLSLNTIFDSQNLPTGLNVLHFRAKDKLGHWSSIISEFVYIQNVTPGGSNSIVAYEYWLNDDYASKVENTSFNQDLAIINISDYLAGDIDGLNQFHIRFKDERGNWSAVQSEFIYVQNKNLSGSNSITEYEYWFDDDYANKTSVTGISDITFNLNLNNDNSIDKGLHKFHIRFKDSFGNWSSIQSEFIYKTTSNTVNKITSYRYWFNDDFANAVTVNNAPEALFIIDDLIDLSSLQADNINYIHFQFKDIAQNWSSVITEEIFTCSSDAGTLTADNSSVILDGSSVNISATPDGNINVPTGYETLFVLTSGSNLIIQDTSTTPDFDVSAVGDYTIHTLVAETSDSSDPNYLDLGAITFGTTTANDVLNIISTNTICADFDVVGAQISVVNCVADAGTLTADEPLVTLTGSSVNISATPDGNINVPTGYETIFVLTTGTDLVIQDTSTTSDFDVSAVGDYTIHTLVAETSDSSDANYLDLSVINFGTTTANDVLNIISNNSLCADLDVVGAQISVVNCVADAGTLTADEPLVTLTGSSANISATPDGNINVPSGYETKFVLTTGNDLVIQDTSTTPDFVVNAVGDYTIHTLVAETSDSIDPNYLDLSVINFGTTTANDVLNIINTNSICADLDVVGAQISVEPSMGINDNSISNLRLAFNPVHDYALVLNNSNILIEQIELYDLRGKLLKRLTINTNDKQIVIDTSLYSDSTYIVIIITEVGIFNMKLIKN